jgi:hypothetical protein
MQTSQSWLRGKTIDSVLEKKKYIFLKLHALACIIPSLKHILKRIILYFAHTRTLFRHFVKDNINITFIHIYYTVYL